MNKEERARFEKYLTDNLGIKVVINEYIPENIVYVISVPPNLLLEGNEECLVLPAVEDFIKNVFEVVKNATKRRQELLLQMGKFAAVINLESLKSTD